MRRLTTAWIICLGIFLAAMPAWATQRVALVVGNSAYDHIFALRNPTNDAEAMADLLSNLGFEVVKGIDLDAAGMTQVLRDFGKLLEGASVGLFFYAGFGLQVWQGYYLIPVDAKPERDDLLLGATDLNLVLRLMHKHAPINLVFLDANRDNAAAITAGKDLAPVEIDDGTLIAYATQLGGVADDGAGRHSPFTSALLEYIPAPGIEVHEMLKRVRWKVARETGGQQIPTEFSSLTEGFYFVPEKSQSPD